MKRILNKILWGLLILLLILVILFYLLFTTEAGLNVAVQIAPRLVSGLKIKSSRGALSKRFVLEQVEYKTQDYHLKFKRVEIVWSPFRWYQKTGLVKQLNIDQFDVNLLPPDPNAESAVSREAKLNWLRQNYFANVHIKELNFYFNDEFKGSVDEVVSTLNPDGTYQISVLFAKGRLYGNAYIHVAENLIWDVALTAEDIDADKIWKGIPATINFEFISKGEWGEEKKDATLLIKNIRGTLQSYPLIGNAALAYKDGNLNIQELYLEFAGSKINVQGTTGERWDLSWDIAIKDLSQLYKNFHGSFLSQGHISGREDKPVISGSLSANQLRLGNIRIATVTGTVTSPLRYDAQANLKLQLHHVFYKEQFFPQITADLLLRRYVNTLQIVGGVEVGRGNTLNLNIGLPDFFKTYKNKINGKVNFNLQTLPRLNISKEVKNLTGRLQGSLSLTGQITDPNVQGEISFRNGSLSVPKYGTRIANINLTGRLEGEKPIPFNGTLTAGAGRARISGFYNPFLQETQYKIQIEGTNLLAVNLREYKITATPNLTITSEGKRASVRGQLFIPKAIIKPDTYETIVTFPEEVRFAHRARKVDPLANLAIRLQLILGDHIYVAYKDVKAYVEGGIFVYQRPGGLPSANGELSIREGVYQAYDRLFTINGGRFVYTGNLLTNPGLSIRALRNVNPCTPKLFGISLNPGPNVDVGLSIQGTLEEPEVSLYSTPALPQDDILSYLVFGQPRSQLGAADALSVLGSMAGGFGGAGSPSDLSGPVNWVSGVFKMGLFGPGQILNFNFPLAKHWVLRTESSFNDIGADFLYVYETPAKLQYTPLVISPD